MLILSRSCTGRSYDSAKSERSTPGESFRQLTYSAVSNLIQNALKYTHTGGKVRRWVNLVGKARRC